MTIKDEMTIKITAEKCCGSIKSEIATDSSSTGETEIVSDATSIKDYVKKRYKRAVDESSGCGCGCGDSSAEFSFVGEAYEGKEGYEADADLGLGCGLPTEFAGINEGDTVLDLGSGAGIDAFVARSLVGATGQIIGVDFTPEMIAKARENARKLGYDNVSFVEGDIEAMPIEDASIDVAVSNCVLNLVPDKEKAFAEMHRVIRPGGHFCISDIVVKGDLPDRIRDSAALYAGCVSGAIRMEAYLNLVTEAGFEKVTVVKDRPIGIPDSILEEVASPAEIEAFRAAGGITSITVTGVRKAVDVFVD